jgi:hypothetical protein
MKTFIIRCLALCMIIQISCRNKNKNDIVTNIKPDDIGINRISKDTVISAEGLPLFYNMYLTVDIRNLFNEAELKFDPTVPNSPNKVGNYELSSAKAANFGVYAVDLSYANAFEQYELCGKYLTDLSRISKELGIPTDYFDNVIGKLKHMSNKDSIYWYVNKLYFETRKHLKSSDQESASAKIVLGGWVEAMYIATSAAEQSANLDILEEIANQKSSVISLLSMLDEFRSDKYIQQKFEKLKEVKASLDNFALVYKHEKLGIKTYQDLVSKIRALRKEIVQ